MLQLSPDWLYRNSRKLPFTRRLGPKALRFSYRGIQMWIRRDVGLVLQRWYLECGPALLTTKSVLYLRRKHSATKDLLSFSVVEVCHEINKV